MRTAARTLASLVAAVALVPWLLSCGGSGDDAAPQQQPAPEDVGGAGLFTQGRVLRNARSVLASMPSVPGARYAWTVENGDATATIVEGAGTNIVRLATGASVGTFVLKATVTAPDGKATVSSRTLSVVQEWLLDSTKPLPRQNHTATLLNDGRVLVMGGTLGFGSGAPNTSAQIYDPETNSWAFARPIPTARTSYTATRLADGRVLVVGGMEGSGTVTASGAAEIYDAASGQWSAVARMRTTRHSHTATLLPDGRVLFAGGSNAASVGGGPVLTAEIYDPATDRWSDAGSISRPREGHAATLLGNGKALLSGGIDYTDRLGIVLESAEIYDPVTNRWSTAGELAIGRRGHTAQKLQDGRVVVAGGIAQGSLMPAEAEVYDPTTGSWSPAGRLNEPRLSHALSLLPDGRLLVSGGAVTTRIQGQPRAEVYDPATNAWTRVADMGEGRAWHTSTTLLNGMVLVVGGIDQEAPLASAERFSPATGTWSSAGRSNARPASSHTATLLRDGTLLQAAGEEGEQALRRASRYDPVLDRWEDVGDMIDARAWHAAALLTTGEVLVTGGQASRLSTDPRLRTAELFDPATRMWRATARMQTGRGRHTATTVPDGRVLVVGGTEVGNVDLASAELYDRAADVWTAAGSMARARTSHAATLLLDGRVLVTGGASPSATAPAEMFDATTNSWLDAAPMSTGRRGHTATRLFNGKVLVVGGYGDTSIPLASAEIYDPASGTWSDAGAMSIGRAFHVATLLPDGTVLASGGIDRSFASPPLASTEIYDPATGAWTLQSPMNLARVLHTSTLLLDGRVVVLGGGGGRFAVTGGVEFWSAGQSLASGVPAAAARAGK